MWLEDDDNRMFRLIVDGSVLRCPNGERDFVVSFFFFLCYFYQ